MSVPPGPTRDKLGEFVDPAASWCASQAPWLAAGDDDLIPTALGGAAGRWAQALSWGDAEAMAAPFEDPSPFVGLAAPDEVTVTRQVLAEPEPGLAAKTWARLADGTPLVTAERRGKGLIVLFHVTADTTWSNLPIPACSSGDAQATTAEGKASLRLGRVRGEDGADAAAMANA